MFWKQQSGCCLSSPLRNGDLLHDKNKNTGNYSRLACEIQFVRSLGFYLIQIYIPSGLIVVISWVSFWLHRQASPARVALGVTTVLTMTTLMSSTNSALPKISYAKSIDVYLGVCFVMVFAALLGERINNNKTLYICPTFFLNRQLIQANGFDWLGWMGKNINWLPHRFFFQLDTP